MQETLVQFLGQEDPLERDRLPTPVLLGFHCGSAGKEPTCNAGGLDSNPGFGRSPGERKGYPLQYSGLENSMDCIVQGVTELNMTEQLSLDIILKIQNNIKSLNVSYYRNQTKMFRKNIFDYLIRCQEIWPL